LYSAIKTEDAVTLSKPMSNVINRLFHRSRIRYLSKKITNFNEFSEIKKFVEIRTKIL